MRKVAVVGRTDVIGEFGRGIQMFVNLHIEPYVSNIEEGGGMVALHIEQPVVGGRRVNAVTIACPRKEPVIFVGGRECPVFAADKVYACL